jgi:hypothetical protein
MPCSQDASRQLTDALKKLGTHKVEVVIEDWHVPDESSHVILTVNLEPINPRLDGGFDIRASQLLHEIQQSPAAIDGAWSLPCHLLLLTLDP